MDKFIAYAKEFDPDFENKIRGAALREIQKLEKLARLPLPEIYKQFLFRFGHEDGGLELAFEGTTDISEIIEFYTDEIDAGEWDVPPSTVIFGVRGLQVEEIGLELLDEGEPRVVFVGGGKITGRYADSLPQLLYRTTFEAKMPLFFSMCVDMQGDTVDPLLEKARDVALRSGFKKQWFSDSIAFCAETPESALILIQYPRNRLAIRLLSQKRSELEKISEKFETALDVSRIDV